MRRLWLLPPLLLAAALLWLQHDPIELDRVEDERIPDAPPAVEEPSALLFVDDAAVVESAAPRRWSALDLSYAWLSALEEEAGRVSVADPRGEDSLEGVGLCVVSRSAWPLPPARLERLDRFARAGGRLLLEQPDRALGFRLGEPGDPRGDLRVLPALSRGPAGWWDGLPVETRVRPLAEKPAEARAFLWLGEDEVAWTVPHGEGALVVLAFDLGRWLTALRQGRPEEDLSVRRRRGSGGREQFLQPNDFLLQPERTEAWLPRADLLLRTVLAAAHVHAPALRLSPVPAGSSGLFLMTHDEENFGDRSTFMSDEVARRGASSTFYVIPQRLTVAGSSAILDAGCEVQLHWNRGFWYRQIRRWGLGPFQPLMREMTLPEQVQQLRLRLPDGAPPIVQNRNHGLLWDEHYTRTFRILEAAGFVFDSSYGPDEELFGHVFDTARPYRPVDTTGRPFAILELPFPFQDDERYDPRWQERLLRDSAAGLRCVMAPIYHTVTMKWNPAAFRMRGWLDSFDMAAAYDHPVWNVGRYLAFRDDRLRGRVRVDRSSEGAWSWRVEVLGPDQAIELRLPAGGAPARLELDGRPIELPERQSWGWRQIPIAEGSHRLRLILRSQEDPR